MIERSFATFFSALVVEPDQIQRMMFQAALEAATFNVTSVGTFEEGKALLVARPPIVLVTEIRLRAYNGLQLALRGNVQLPGMTILVTSAFRDPVLQREAEKIGATFMPKPVTPQEFIAAVHRTALRQPNAAGVLEPIRPPFERRLSERRTLAPAGATNDRRRSERRRDIATVLFREFSTH